MTAGTISDALQISRGCAPIAVSAPEKKPSAGAMSVNGRASSTYSLDHRPSSPPRSPPPPDPAPTAEFMKLSALIVENPWPFERRAEHALDERRHRRGADDDRHRRRAGHEPEPARPLPPESRRTGRPPACPPMETAPDVPGGTRRKSSRAMSASPIALPTSLATVSLADVTIAAAIASCARRPLGTPTESIAAHAARPVLAIALPGPRRPPRSSAIPGERLARESCARRHRRRENSRRAAPTPPSGADEDQQCR